MKDAEAPFWLRDNRRWEEGLDLIEALITDTSLDDGLPWRLGWSTRDQTDRFRAFLRSPDSRESIALMHAYLALTDSSPRPPSSLVAWSVVRDYAFTEVRRRRHQQKARRLLLAHGDATCSYCGLDRVEILDAAHLVPDSEGGEASSENMRLLCKNHHAAQEIGLLQHRPTDDTWHWKDGIQRF